MVACLVGYPIILVFVFAACAFITSEDSRVSQGWRPKPTDCHTTKCIFIHYALACLPCNKPGQFPPMQLLVVWQRIATLCTVYSLYLEGLLKSQRCGVAVAAETEGLQASFRHSHDSLVLLMELS